MADNNQGNFVTDPDGQEQSTGRVVNDADVSTAEYLKSIDATLKQMLKNQSASASNFRNDYRDRQSGVGSNYRTTFRDSYRNRRGYSSAPRGFEEGLQEALLESVLGKDFKRKMQTVLGNFADAIGADLSDIPGMLGKAVGQKLVDLFKGSEFGSKVSDRFDKLRDQAIGSVKDRFFGRVADYDARNGTDWSSKFKDVFNTDSSAQAARDASRGARSGSSPFSGFDAAAGAEAAGEGIIDTEVASAELASSMEGASVAVEGLAAAAPELLIAAAAVAVAMYALGPAIEGTRKMMEAAGEAADRYRKSRKQNVKLEEERLQADLKSIVEAPFKILEDAANKVYDTWDSALRKISGTQGYSKSDVQDLMSAYGQRLRSEGLTDVINAADLTSNLASVIDSGLTGPIAEEFAYIATKLSAAVPTQDFFQYSDTYAAMVSTAMAQGKSQQDAITYANAQLEQYASNILYASRTLTGGINTGLKDAQSILSDSLKIVQANRSGDLSKISGTLASISAVVGAYAPDLASSVVESILQTAIGGNSEDIVALRSLAGINASNSEFLREIATNPKKVFVDLFNKLSELQDMSEANRMEVAEGLSNIFNISKDALARVDFHAIATAVQSMSISTASLEENMSVLTSGESTLTKEQLRNQEINKYLVEEGLAYVLDNEVARAVQQHMWEEQLAREVMEAEYAVNLQGTALEFLEGIRSTVDIIRNVLNPFGFIVKSISNLTTTIQQAQGQDSDLKQILLRGRVGQGTAREFYNLTTRGQNLNLIGKYVELLGGQSAERSAVNTGNIVRGLVDPLEYLWDNRGSLVAMNYLQNSVATISSFNNRTKYSWGSISKSLANAFADRAGGISPSQYAAEDMSATNRARQALEAAIKPFFEASTIEEKIREGRASGQAYTYADWQAETMAGLSKAGVKVTDLKEALETVGQTENSVRQMFEEAESKAGAEREADHILTEEAHWAHVDREISEIRRILDEETNRLWLRSIFEELRDITNDTWLRSIDSHVAHIDSNLDSFWNTWNNYIYKHTVYNEAIAQSWNKVTEAEEKAKKSEQDDLANALAEALVQNTVDLKDPAVQTNVLLARILIIATAIMEQNNKTASPSQLIDDISAAALGAN